VVVELGFQIELKEEDEGMV